MIRVYYSRFGENYRNTIYIYIQIILIYEITKYYLAKSIDQFFFFFFMKNNDFIKEYFISKNYHIFEFIRNKK